MPIFHHQTQISVGRIAQEASIHPHAASSLTQNDFPTLEELLDSVLGWLDQGAPDRWRLRGTSEDLERVIDHLHNLGLKPRYDWDSKSNTMIVRSPTGIHEVPGAWLARTGVAYLEKDIEERSLCGEFKLGVGGARAVDLITSTGELGGTLVPDQSLCLLQVGADGKKAHVQNSPRIVMETSAGQSLKDVIDKVFQRLYETDRAVHAVIICNFTNMPSPESDKPFKAEIAVWVRPESEDLTLDYPCDECHGAHKHTTQAHSPALVAHEESDALGRGGGGDAGESNSDTAHINPDFEESNTEASGDRSQTPYIPPFDPLAHEHSRLNPEDPHQEQRICCRSGSWIVVYDESTSARQGEAKPEPEPAPEPELLLDVYDILRPCSKFPKDRVTNRVISVPLGALRKELASEVRRMRRPPSIPLASPLPQTASSSRPVKKRRIA
ncbi:hypothetical protein RSOLAG22IIIB_04108 [Rhizoctonia solani]|uniref:Uncharacterized protein n=1 Tax=Rhizoctonia solani TaxID=456999 RepID=A0A0K6FUM6_9AGAM|nr:hypothetical protein RSOLAG22IIIB_04108 [Rhizoctonia solani]